jgi:hypothetical protein
VLLVEGLFSRYYGAAVMSAVPLFNTPGVIARKLKVPLHRVLYVLETRRHIQHTARAGTLRLYDNHAIAQIRHELNAIDARRSARKEADDALAF